MSARAATTIEVERALGSAVAELLATMHGEVGQGDAGDAMAEVLAAHALVDSVAVGAVCVLAHDDTLRVAAVSGATGTVASGSEWQLPGSPVATALAGTATMTTVSAADSPLAEALAVPVRGELLAVPLRVGAGSHQESISLGALLLVRGEVAPLTDDERAFLTQHASLVALAMLGVAPAQQWARREHGLRDDVDAVVDLVGSPDARQLIPSVLQRTCESLDASSATLLRIDGEDVCIEGSYDVDGLRVTPSWRGALADQPVLREAMEAGHVMVGDTATGRLPNELGEALRDVCSTMIVPLRVRDRATGFMVVMRRHPRPFLDDDSVTVPLLANVALLALRSSRLHADAQAASQAMSSFLNLVVHDLRAPLTVLSGYIDLLRDGTFGEAPAEWSRPMEMIATKLTETNRLVDDILLAARLEAGAVPTTIERLDLTEVIGRAAARSEARAALAGARIEVAPDAGPVSVDADSFHVDRIVDNLINNALNYGGSSPWVRLSIDTSAEPAIRVEDRGVGISPELHGRIFDRFFRVNNRVPGTGFGLHVARVLAEACGGSLRVERSALGKGSVFRLELPAASF
jgi:signal transduction histidine kinase